MKTRRKLDINPNHYWAVTPMSYFQCKMTGQQKWRDLFERAINKAPRINTRYFKLDTDVYFDMLTYNIYIKYPHKYTQWKTKYKKLLVQNQN